MDDPNVVYKLAYANLTRELGRNPTSNELLGLHDQYKKSFEEEKRWRTSVGTVEPKSDSTVASGDTLTMRVSPTGAPVPTGASGHQAGESIPSTTRTREDQEALYGPRINADGEQAEREPEPPAFKPEPSERPTRDEQDYADGYHADEEGTRGADGGIVARCRKCERLFERPARKGRPPVECETCRD